MKQIILACALLFGAAMMPAQDNYEIQVYGSGTMAPKRTMFEVHSNFTFRGAKTGEDGVYPTNHALHETIEITHGWNDWFETGFYLFTAHTSIAGMEYVGNHFRPRVRVPPSWNWKVGASLSMEMGYQRHQYSADTWTWEIRPIVDKQVGKWYLGFNPTMARAWHGPGVRDGLVFSPNVKAAYSANNKIAVGVEYYGSLGPLRTFDVLRQQEHQMIPSIDVNFGPDWEFNFGVGAGLTPSTDRLLVKLILGRRFSGWNMFKKSQ